MRPVVFKAPTKLDSKGENGKPNSEVIPGVTLTKKGSDKE